MKLLIAGSRGFYNSKDDEVLEKHYKLGLEVLDKVYTEYDITRTISGKAKGADSFGELWAKSKDLIVSEYPANWDLYGKGAGHIRNKTMGDLADIAVIFWDSKSKGTKNMIDYIRKLKKPLVLIEYNAEDDEW
jgi:hypothetical protein